MTATTQQLHGVTARDSDGGRRRLVVGVPVGTRSRLAQRVQNLSQGPGVFDMGHVSLAGQRARLPPGVASTDYRRLRQRTLQDLAVVAARR